MDQDNTTTSDDSSDASDDLSAFLPILMSLRAPRLGLATAPTFVPKTFADSIQYGQDGSLYVYMNTSWEQFAPAGAGGTVFGGGVVSNAAASFFPSGWTVVHSGAGIYQVLHTLGTANYAVTVSPNVFAERFAIVYDKDSTQFWVALFAYSGGAPTDTDFDFIVTK